MNNRRLWIRRHEGQASQWQPDLTKRADSQHELVDGSPVFGYAVRENAIMMEDLDERLNGNPF